MNPIPFPYMVLAIITAFSTGFGAGDWHRAASDKRDAEAAKTKTEIVVSKKETSNANATTAILGDLAAKPDLAPAVVVADRVRQRSCPAASRVPGSAPRPEAPGAEAAGHPQPGGTAPDTALSAELIQCAKLADEWDAVQKVDDLNRN